MIAMETSDHYRQHIVETYCYVIRVEFVPYGQRLKHSDAVLVFHGIFCS